MQWIAANDYIIKVQVYRGNVNGQLTIPKSLDIDVYQIGTNIQ